MTLKQKIAAFFLKLAYTLDPEIALLQSKELDRIRQEGERALASAQREWNTLRADLTQRYDMVQARLDIVLDEKEKLAGELSRQVEQADARVRVLQEQLKQLTEEVSKGLRLVAPVIKLDGENLPESESRSTPASASE